MILSCNALRACAFLGALMPALACAQPEYETWNAAFQATYVWQAKPSFPAAYSGEHSLSSAKEKSYTFSATAYLGLRPWSGGELYFNPEVVQGMPLSDVHGLGGPTNGEIQKTSGPNPTFYRARFFLRQTWGMGGGAQDAESAQNQLAGRVDARRLVLTAGNLAVTDAFDRNDYAGDARTQFLNWSFLTYGAYDFAADARGYTWGAALEWYHDEWVLRAGRFLQPREPNGQQLDYSMARHHGDQVEIAHTHTLGERPGVLRLLAFRNKARMSRYEDALDLAAATGGTPDINEVRTGDRFKIGLGLGLQQAWSDSAGVFARAMWADGKTETYAFTEIDRSLALGAIARGASWGRGEDSLGLALALNGLSREHRAYLAAGGLGFFIGDGRLDYRPEAIVEGFYSLNLAKRAWASLDWQHIRNPAYNADRGPVNVAALRLHTEF